MFEELYVEKAIARLVDMYPKKESMGSTIPNIDMNIRGSMQYPRTDVDLANDRFDDKLCW